jgi:hypothetical protein
MYAAVSTRSLEIATLRSIGFGHHHALNNFAFPLFLYQHVVYKYRIQPACVEDRQHVLN